MSGKVISLNDEMPQTFKIRRDQHKRIKDIVDTNNKFPIVALGLVRDYVKNCSASSVVAAVNFGEDYGSDPTSNPKHIVVHTIESGRRSAESLGTTYYFRLNPEPKIEAPTL